MSVEWSVANSSYCNRLCFSCVVQRQTERGYIPRRSEPLALVLTRGVHMWSMSSDESIMHILVFNV